MTWTKCVAACVAMVAALVANSAGVSAQDKKEKPDKRPGQRWEYKVTDKSGKSVEDGKFRAHEFKLYKLDNQIGTFEKTGKNELTIDITKGELRGKVVMKRDGGDWEGAWTPKGSKRGELKISIKPFEK